MRPARAQPVMTPAARAALIDAYFDGDMDDASRRAFLDSLATDPETAQEFARTAFVVESLARPVASPDLTDRVLQETARRTRGRAWVSASVRRWTLVGRVAVAACLLLTLSVALVARRAQPDQFVQRPAPLSALVRESSAGAADTVNALGGAFRSARDAARRLGSLASAEEDGAPNEPARTAAYIYTSERDAEDAGELIVRWSAAPAGTPPDIGPPRALWRRGSDLVVARNSPPRGW